MLTFHYLERKFGAPAAYHWLAEIEKAAGIQSWRMADLDPEMRLAKAIQTQDSMCESAIRRAA